MRLYIGNLPYSVNDAELRQMFEPHGAVVGTSVVIDRETGRSRGFGFVEMGSPEEGKKAIEAMNGQNIGGRALVVNEARPKEDKPRGGWGGGGGGGRGGRGGGGGGRW